MRLCATYYDEINFVKRWYNRDSKKERFLTAWKSLTLKIPCPRARLVRTVCVPIVRREADVASKPAIHSLPSRLIHVRPPSHRPRTLNHLKSLRDMFSRTRHKCENNRHDLRARPASAPTATLALYECFQPARPSAHVALAGTVESSEQSVGCATAACLAQEAFCSH